MRPSSYPRWLAFSALTALSLLTATPSSAAQGAQAAPADAPVPGASDGASIIDPINLVLYSVELDSLTLSDGLAAYGDAADPHLPIGELTRLLEMDVDVFPAEGRLIGRLGEARRSLVLDLASRTAREGGREVQLTPEDIAVTPTEIYIRASAASKLFAIRFDVNGQNLVIKIVPSERLPIQTRQERMARLRTLGPDLTANAEALRVETPYRLFTLPAFDIQLGSAYQSTAPHTPTRYDVRMASDLLWGNFQGYVASDESGRPSSAQAVLERRSIPGNLLGPLKARVVAAGDVYTPSLALGPRGAGGRGFMLSTVPLDQSNIFNRIDLRGELPLGYDVELYVNDILRSGGQAGSSPVRGRYEFLNVPLSPGINVVSIVTYGPRGERSEQTRVVNVGGGLLTRGEANFELGAVQQGSEVINLSPPLGGGQVVQPGEGGLRAVAIANYGLTSFLTVSAGAAYLPLTRDTGRQIYNLGFRTSILGWATQVDTAMDDAQGQAGFVGLAGRVMGASLVLRHAEFRNGFLDENGTGYDSSRATVRRSEASFDVSLELANRIVPVSARAQRVQYVGGFNTITSSLRASSSIGAVLVSSGLEYERAETPQSVNQRLSGFFAGSTYRDFLWQLRATLDYDILPEWSARSVSLSADRDITETWAVRLGVGQPLDDLKGTNFTAASIHRLGIGDLSVTGQYNNSDKSYMIGAQLSFGLNWNPMDNRYQVTRPGAANGGSVVFNAFTDMNGNGVRDEGDEPVKNVTLEGGERRAVTDQNGRAYITGLSGNGAARVIVGLDQVDNPSVQTPPSTIEIRARAGRTVQVDYPMRPTGDVMVRINLKLPDGTIRGLAALRLIMTGTDGRTFEASTEYDGTASFAQIPIGSYKIELDPAEAARLRMRLARPLSTVVKLDGGFGSDVEGEVILLPREEQPAPAE